MVKALHAAGIEVILDVVFNHTVEGNETGPTLSLRGFDNAAYYKLEPTNLRSTSIAPAPATRSRSAMPRCATWSSIACATGSRKCTSMASASISPPCSAATTVASAPTRLLQGGRRRAVAALREADRRAVGHRPRRLSARPLSGRLVRVERSVSRHDARLLARQSRHPRQLRRALRRLERSVPRQRPPADREHQLRRLSRRLHAVRRDRVRREAQRGESRRQPRRPQSQPELELRRRRSDRRSAR